MMNLRRFVPTPLVAVAAACALGAAGLGCGKILEGYDKGFKESYQREFAKSCSDAAVSRGVKQPSAQAICGCMGKYMVEHYTSTELTLISADAKSDKAKDAFEKAGVACRASSAGR